MTTPEALARGCAARLAHALNEQWATHWWCTGGYYALPANLRHTPWADRILSAWPVGERRACDECGCTLGRKPAAMPPTLTEAMAEKWSPE